jgi:hypothetical protein
MRTLQNLGMGGVKVQTYKNFQVFEGFLQRENIFQKTKKRK